MAASESRLSHAPPAQKTLHIKCLGTKVLVRTIKSPKNIAKEVLGILGDGKIREDQRRKGTELLAWMEEPTRKILKTVKMAPGTWKLN